MHDTAHDKGFEESRGNLVVTRGMNVFSRTLGVSGQCDVLEFRRSADGIPIDGRAGLWQPYPVEYKHGKPNPDSGDILQLCGQAMCLEEMLCCPIPEGAFFCGEIRRRQKVSFTPELRAEVKADLMGMHDLYRRGYTPKVKPTKGCRACPLKQLCLPKLMRGGSVYEYMEQHMENGV